MEERMLAVVQWLSVSGGANRQVGDLESTKEC